MLEKLPLDRFRDGFGGEAKTLLVSSPAEFADVALLCLRPLTGIDPNKPLDSLPLMGSGRGKSKSLLRFSTLSCLVGDAIEMLGFSLLVKCGEMLRLQGLPPNVLLSSFPPIAPD
jgi:hypothetical protein